ncbi:MAG: response regulator [Bacteroidales bacterium]|nr:response regulator [Bacteroidales bacterium]
MDKIKLLLLTQSDADKSLMFFLSKHENFSITSFNFKNFDKNKINLSKTDIIVILANSLNKDEIGKISDIKKSFGEFIPIVSINKKISANIEQQINAVMSFCISEHDTNIETIAEIIKLVYEKTKLEQKSFISRNILAISNTINILSFNSDIEKICEIITSSKLFNSVLISTPQSSFGIGLKDNIHLDIKNVKYSQNLTNPEKITLITKENDWIYKLGKNYGFKTGIVFTLKQNGTESGFLALTSEFDLSDEYFSTIVISTLKTSIENYLSKTEQKTSVADQDLNIYSSKDNHFATFCATKEGSNFIIKSVSSNFFDLTNIDITNNSFLDVILDVFYPKINCPNRTKITTITNFEDVIKINHKKNGHVWLRLHSELSNNQIRGLIYDISELKNKEEKSEEEKTQAEFENKQKSAFLVNLSYDIRTSLNSILGFSSLLTSEEINIEKRRKYGEIVKTSGQKMMKIIDDILDISRLDIDDFKLSKEKCTITYFLKDVEMFYSKLLSENENVDFLLMTPEYTEDLVIETDIKRLHQIFDILISNSLKYTLDGTISIGFEIDEQSKEIIFFVKDTGIGIPEEIKATIFERYKYAPEIKMTEGAGVSLGIAKGIIDNMKGEMWVESDVMEGADFYFSIPFKKISSGKSEQIQPLQHANFKINMIEGKNIFIAEDNDFAFEFLLEILSEFKPIIKRAEDGEELMDMLKNETPDLIILDIKMPKKDGFECFKEIKTSKINSKIIIQTAFALDFEKENFLKSGGHAFIRKPIIDTVLINAIELVMSSYSEL